jgi:hypothetical protein
MRLYIVAQKIRLLDSGRTRSSRNEAGKPFGRARPEKPQAHWGGFMVVAVRWEAGSGMGGGMGGRRR